jgi:hypothetical protein
MNVTLNEIMTMAEQLSRSEQDALLEQLQSARNEADQREWCDLCDQMAGSFADDPM